MNQVVGYWMAGIYAVVIAAFCAFIFFANRYDERQALECAERGGQIMRGGHLNRGRYCRLPNGEVSR